MEIVLIIVGVLILAALAYMGNRSRKRRRIEEMRRREKLAAEAEGHRSMAGQHEQKAEELQEQSEREAERAERHQRRAAEADPEIQTEADARR